MNDEIINPFKQRKTDWVQKSREKLIPQKELNTKTEVEKKQVEICRPSKSIVRVAKSFKIYKGQLSRDFDKRVNKMQVHFDDLDFEKNYVDSGKYIMFLMAFAEQYGIYELYKEVNGDGKLEISKQEILNNIGKHL